MLRTKIAIFVQSRYLGPVSGVYNTQGFAIMMTFIQIFNNL